MDSQKRHYNTMRLPRLLSVIGATGVLVYLLTAGSYTDGADLVITVFAAGLGGLMLGLVINSWLRYRADDD